MWRLMIILMCETISWNKELKLSEQDRRRGYFSTDKTPNRDTLAQFTLNTHRRLSAGEYVRMSKDWDDEWQQLDVVWGE